MADETRCSECGQRLPVPRTKRTGSRTVDETGRRFGRLTVIGFAEHRHNGVAYWRCRCDCGEERIVQGSTLRNGRSQSCGCLKADTVRTHGMEGTKIYNIWASMKARCQNPEHQAFKNYGGRGIKVCKRWQKFENFYADMGDKPEGLSLDRINNDGDYKPSNCRWATWLEQEGNRRPPRKRKAV